MSVSALILLHLNYILALYKKNFGLIDIAWGLGFIFISFTGSLLNSFNNFSEVIIFVLVSAWGLRLSGYLFLRNFGHDEDFRYREMRTRWGTSANKIAYFKIYWLQFILMLLVALPLFSVHNSTSNQLEALGFLGIFIWAFGFCWESVSDFQKSRFKKNPKNRDKLCQEGLWNLSRHPNYFGESLVWWGIGLISIRKAEYWGLIGPLFINYLLVKVSGVPLIEKRHRNHPDFPEYEKNTPRLLPRFSKLFIKKV
jgi:steroid 5-alpha reductase family enzyme